ncbi:NAD(+) synthase, partial [Ligilactobacillus agilis]
MRPLQAEIIKTLRVQAEIDPQAEIRRSVDFMKAYLKKHSFLKALVLGISGGQDSTLAGKLSQMAISELRQETGDSDYKFIAVRLPYGQQADEQDALDAIEFMQADLTVRVNIKEAADQMVAALEANGLTISDFNKGNIKARQRMIAQYGIAGAYQGAVVGTDHAA